MPLAFSAMQGTAIFKINFGTEIVQVVPNWWYRNGTGGGPEHDIAFCVVPKWTGTETDHHVVPKWSGTKRYLPLHFSKQRMQTNLAVATVGPM